MPTVTQHSSPCGGADFPTYTLPEAVTADGWYRREATGASGRESDNECRARAARVAASLRADAAALQRSKNVILVAHYDLICAVLDALLLMAGGRPVHSGPFDNFRHFNTGISIVDIRPDGTVAPMMLNAIPHLATRPELVTGFPLS